jgi:hypothetical protein
LLIDVDENWLTKQDDGTAITATNNCSIPVWIVAANDQCTDVCDDVTQSYWHVLVWFDAMNIA